MSKRTIILIVVLALIVFATFAFVLYHYLEGLMEKEMQTETCQIALEHLLNKDEVQQKYGSDAQPKLYGIEKHVNADGVTDHIQYRFKFPESGEQYIVEMYYELDELIVKVWN